MSLRTPLGSFPLIDLSSVDLSRLAQLDPRQFEVAGLSGERVLAMLRDAAYVGVGASVLTFQQLQVRRRELTARLSDSPVASQVGLTKEQIDDIVDRLGSTRSHLPAVANVVLEQAHGAAKLARQQVRSLLRLVA